MSLAILEAGITDLVAIEQPKKMIGPLHDILEMAIAVCAHDMHDIDVIEDNAFDEPMFQRYQVRIIPRKVRRKLTSQTARGPPDLQDETEHKKNS